MKKLLDFCLGNIEFKSYFKLIIIIYVLKMDNYNINCCKNCYPSYCQMNTYIRRKKCLLVHHKLGGRNIWLKSGLNDMVAFALIGGCI